MIRLYGVPRLAASVIRMSWTGSKEHRLSTPALPSALWRARLLSMMACVTDASRRQRDESLFVQPFGLHSSSVAGSHHQSPWCSAACGCPEDMPEVEKGQ